MTKATVEEVVCLDLQVQSDAREAMVAGNGYGGWSSQPRERAHTLNKPKQRDTMGNHMSL